MRAPPSWPNHLPKASPPNTITLGIRFQHKNFVETRVHLSLSLSLSLSLLHTHTHTHTDKHKLEGQKVLGKGSLISAPTVCTKCMLREFLHIRRLSLVQCASVAFLKICNQAPTMCQALSTQRVFNSMDASCSDSFSEQSTSRRPIGNGLHKRNVANRGLAEDSHSCTRMHTSKTEFAHVI